MDGARLCGSCGLCCDGTIFDGVPIDGSLLADARSRALPIAVRPGGPELRQPCPHHGADGLCAVYAARPAECARFECALLRRLRAGDVTDDDALARVAEARALAASLRARLGRGDVWQAFDAYVQDAHADPAVMLEAGALARLLAEHFEPTFWSRGKGG